MPFPPRGLKAVEHPLKHRFSYSFGLSCATGTMNSAWATIVRSSHDPAIVNPNTIKVNPHVTDQDEETGPLCQTMSILDNLKIIVIANKSVVQNTNTPIKCQFTPFFCSFGEKYDAADDDTGTTVASVMQLTKDATNKDIVPLTATKLSTDGGSDLAHPMSTVNDAEAFGDYNMTTDTTMEATAFDREAFLKLVTIGTNKGALKACLGKTRSFTLDRLAGVGRTNKSYYFKKFLPRPIRRITEFTYFGLLFHIPLPADLASLPSDNSLTGSKSDVLFRVIVRYDEWNAEHDNSMVASA